MEMDPTSTHPQPGGHMIDPRRAASLPRDFADLLPEPLPADPMPLLKQWLDEATSASVQPNPSAMTLSTCDADNRPSSRIVLCRGMDTAAGTLTFFTNYLSPKGRQIEGTHAVAIVFFWDVLMRQARIEGAAQRAPESESDDYFRSRPWISKIGAWASEQSRPIGSRAEMLERFDDAMRRFSLDPKNPPALTDEVDIPRPPHWGGYTVRAERIELWVSGPGRVHDRAQWTRSDKDWASTRLQP